VVCVEIDLFGFCIVGQWLGSSLATQLDYILLLRFVRNRSTSSSSSSSGGGGGGGGGGSSKSSVSTLRSRHGFLNKNDAAGIM
jgi:uncharacterized membrane protein YgcG